MDEELFVKLLNLRKYLDAQSDKFITWQNKKLDCTKQRHVQGMLF